MAKKQKNRSTKQESQASNGDSPATKHGSALATQLAPSADGKPVFDRLRRRTARPRREIVIPVRAASGSPPVRYELVGKTRGAAIDEVSGELQWTPEEKHLGTNRFTIEATDADGHRAQYSVEVYVSSNQTPTIDPISDQTVPVGQHFSYQVQAHDPDGDSPLTYQLVWPVPPFSISSTGLISGRPASPATLTIEVQVSDPSGASAREAFDLTVQNLPPVIEPIADQTTPVGQPFSYPVQAHDPENQALTFEFVHPVPGFTISGGGLISGTPTTPGTVTIQVRVSDPHGAYSLESFDLTIQNLPPVIEPIADQTTPVGQPFSYPVQAHDPEGQDLTFQFAHPVAGFTISDGGLISGTPTTPGTITIQVRVSDPHGAYSLESFDLTIQNLPPVIDPIADQTTPVGQPFSYPVQAHDPEGQDLTFQFAHPVAGFTISGGGLISGTPTTPGTITIQVRVSDPHGAYSLESFDLTIQNLPPVIDPISDQIAQVDEYFSYQVQATDPEGQAKSYQLVHPVPGLSISSNGLITGMFSSAGTRTVEVQVSDPYGAYSLESFDIIVQDGMPMGEEAP